MNKLLTPEQLAEIKEDLIRINQPMSWLLTPAGHRAINHAESLLSHIRASEGECVWKSDDKDFDYACWNASCGAEWYLEEGNPTENNMKFCPECGGRLILEDKS